MVELSQVVEPSLIVGSECVTRFPLTRFWNPLLKPRSGVVANCPQVVRSSIAAILWWPYDQPRCELICVSDQDGRQGVTAPRDFAGALGGLTVEDAESIVSWYHM